MSLTEHRIRKLLGRGGTVRSRELRLVDAGLTRSELSRMVASGRLPRVARSLYAASGYESVDRNRTVIQFRNAL